MVVRTYIQIETVVATQAGYVIKQVGQLFQRFEFFQPVDLLQSDPELLGIDHLIDLRYPFFDIGNPFR